jgi:glycosyltransferase involved in cell wall biosynthesis/CDP-glycerol glycerophosphotransferase (TagB/SpsB family)
VVTESRPSFSIVTAVYNVEPYLPDFIASIEAQTFKAGRIEVIAIDDGSTDGSLAVLEAWARRRPRLVKVSSQPNAGQGAARNLGLEQASGTWVTFTDPDDMLDPDYFAVADRFARAHPDVQVMAGKPWLLEEAKGGRVSDAHPRRAQYDAGDRRVNLDHEPDTFTGSATVSLFRLDRIRARGLTFDTRIRPNFEDGHFAVCFLLGLPKPVVGILRDARYIYRKRAAGDSTLQTSYADPGRYTDVLRYGYLDVLERGRARTGTVPVWLQHVLIYELSWYLSADDGARTEIRMAPEIVPVFHDLLGQVIRQLDPEVVRRHQVRPLKSVWVDILAHACRPADWHSPVVARTKVDRDMGLQRLSYRYIGTPPRETFTVGGDAVRPVHGKAMAHDYYGRTLVFERIAWLPQGPATEVRLAGESVRVVDGWPEPRRRGRPSSRLERIWAYRRLTPGEAGAAIVRAGRRRLGRFAEPAMAWMARRWPYRTRFADAWVLIDRVYNADDNAERLFEYLRAERPDINAWFVIEKDSPDWRRMRAAGVRRLVPFGSFTWKMLMLNASWLLSSHADVAITRPAQLMKRLRRPTWRYGFLQHGVIKDDLSKWLNQKDMDLFLVSTDDERTSVTADGTGYVVTTKETHLTGLPRFDRLLAKARRYRPDDRDLILIAPTWRQWLTEYSDPDSQRHALSDSLWTSDYMRNWDAVLRSERIAEAAAIRRWRVGFMPHPNMQPALERMRLPPHVEAITFEDGDVQDLYARCALLVTDYSSVAFNIAYIDAPVVYFQFDRDEMLGGAHIGRRGYFDYAEHGFGPVALDADSAIEAIVASIKYGPVPTDLYQARIDRTFTDRDGRACARVVAAIESLGRPYDAADPAS